MIYPGDPLALEASTWSGLHGPKCRICKVDLEVGHRYYEEDEGVVVHYGCLAREDATRAALGL